MKKVHKCAFETKQKATFYPGTSSVHFNKTVYKEKNINMMHGSVNQRHFQANYRKKAHILKQLSYRVEIDKRKWIRLTFEFNCGKEDQFERIFKTDKKNSSRLN